MLLSSWRLRSRRLMPSVAHGFAGGRNRKAARLHDKLHQSAHADLCVFSWVAPARGSVRRCTASGGGNGAAAGCRCVHDRPPWWPGCGGLRVVRSRFDGGSKGGVPPLARGFQRGARCHLWRGGSKEGRRPSWRVWVEGRAAPYSLAGVKGGGAPLQAARFVWQIPPAPSVNLSYKRACLR